MNISVQSGPGGKRALAAALGRQLDQVGWLHGWRMERATGAVGGGCDLLVTLPRPGGGHTRLCVACKNELRPSMFRQFAERPFSAPAKATVRVLGLPSVSPRMAELCEEQGWGWFDLAGNCRLDVPGVLHIHRSGMAPVHRRPPPRANLGTPQAGRVIRALLIPEHAGKRWTQRHLAEHFGAIKPAIPRPSLGLVNKVVRYLRDEAFIEDLADGGFRLRDPARLLFAWRDAYRFDRHERRSYFTLLQGGGLREALARFGAQAGGLAVYAAFSAADRQAPHVRQPKTWLYVKEQEIPRFERMAEAKRVESGENLVVFLPDDDGVFYPSDGGGQAEHRLGCTNEVQTYVDLCHSGGRGAEAAEALLEQGLKPKWNATGLKV